MTRTVLGADEDGLARVSAAAATVTTPFHLYDTGVFAARAALLRDTLPGALLYSAKANPHPALLATAAAAGCDLELASEGELDALASAGVAAGRAILVGPAKTDALLATAVERGVGTVVVESLGELRRLITVADRSATGPTSVLLRLGLDGARGSLRMSGHQFGMEHAEVLACLELLATTAAVSFAGYHGYLASQLLRAADIEHNSRLVSSAAATLAGLGFPGARLDLGGGFGIGYTPGDPDLDLAEVAAGLGRVRRSVRAGTTLMFESGRFLAGPSGVLVCAVVDVKTTGGRRFVLLDGGINTSGLFGGGNGIRGLRHSVVRDGAVLSGGPPSHLCGPLCTPMDRLATSVPCAADVGDLVVWWNTGAYGFSAAPVNFLSFPPAVEVVV